MKIDISERDARLVALALRVAADQFNADVRARVGPDSQRAAILIWREQYTAQERDARRLADHVEACIGLLTLP